MIRPVTFKAAKNFKANLYALEVKSRFIDQTAANGYYSGYGNELSATTVGTSGITIGSGALLVQGRMLEIVSSETVSITYSAGKVGYIICRIETSPAEGVVNCSLISRTGTTLSAITLTRENTYIYESEETNKVYELPIYSFSMANSAISNVVKLVSAIGEIAAVKAIADNAKSTADTAKSTADTAKSTADTAKSTADTAKSTADAAKSTANNASETASSALSIANASGVKKQYIPYATLNKEFSTDPSRTTRIKLPLLDGKTSDDIIAFSGRIDWNDDAYFFTAIPNVYNYCECNNCVATHYSSIYNELKFLILAIGIDGDKFYCDGAGRIAAGESTPYKVSYPDPKLYYLNIFYK